MTALQNFKLALQKLGLRGTLRLLNEKRAKKRRLAKLLRAKHGFAQLVAPPTDRSVRPTEEEITTITERANEMLADENYVFTFLHHLKNIPDVWNYDPLENKYWLKKRYEETQVHSADSPSEVKIVWEINRFKYLPLLAEAAYLTKEKKYADEIQWRILSWIEDNPFAGSINWSSPLEIAIRAISWTASLRILALAGFDISKNEEISKSIWEHAAYLNAELSTDKIVRTNHLIGETAGLYILSSFFDFPEAVFYKLRAKKILTGSILEQTDSLGESLESSGWYHTFVTDFADLALRTAQAAGDSFDKEFTERFEKMSIYRNSIILPDGDVVKYGDIDFGKAINLSAVWKEMIFGENTVTSKERKNYFDFMGSFTALLGTNYVFARSGGFGWGGKGFSSHAHDDLLAPIVALEGINILVDPGTFAYNGSPETRDDERMAGMHNRLIITGIGATGREPNPIPKPGFGWLKTPMGSMLSIFRESEDEISVRGSLFEWLLDYERNFTLTKDKFILEDRLGFYSDVLLEWNFHFHPRWRVEKIDPSKFALHDFRDNHFLFEISDVFTDIEILRYDFYPAYRQKSKAWKIRIRDRYISHPEPEKKENRIVRFILKRM